MVRVTVSGPHDTANAPSGRTRVAVDPGRLMLWPSFTGHDLALAILFGLGLRAVAILLESLTNGGFALPGLVLFDDTLSLDQVLWAVAIPIFVAPWLEEWIFRGVLQPLAVRVLRVVGVSHGVATAGAVILVAAAFALGHVLLAPGAWPLTTSAALLMVGLTCGGLVVLTGRLGTAIGVHFVFNLSGVALLLGGTFR